MRGGRCALRAGEYLVRRACRRPPARIGQERYQEWLAELPVILRDRDTGPAPLRVVRMLAFAADTLRGTALAADAYRGAHRGTAAKNLRWPGTGLLLPGGLPGGALFLLACEGCISCQLAASPHLTFSVQLALVNAGYLAASCIPRCDRQPVRMGSPAAVCDHQLLRLRDLRRLPWHGRGPCREIPLPAPAR